MWSKVLLIGDSLTQYSFSPDGCWAALLQNRVQRVADVLCRGLAGYNTRWIRALLPELLTGIDASSVSCVVLFLCANDCAHENCPSGQHVPLDEFRDNLKSIVQYLEQIGIGKERIVMVNIPKYYHDEFAKSRDQTPSRSSESAAKYASACLQVAEELAVSRVDIHSAFDSDPRGRSLLSDGLHLSAAGSQLVFDEIWPFVEKKITEFHGTQSLEQNFPYWMQFRDNFNQRNVDQNIP